MNITRKNQITELSELGDYTVTQTKSNGESKDAGIVIVCECGELVSLGTKNHTFKSYDPLDVEPSILHKRDDRGLKDCHYFIRNGEHVAA